MKQVKDRDRHIQRIQLC